MEKITMTVDRNDAVNAMATAYEYAKFYRDNRKPNVPCLMGKKYFVHHTKSGTIVIKQRS